MGSEDVFREANDRIVDRAVELDWRDPLPLLCECSDRRCFAKLRVTREEYESVRAHPEQYLVKPGHELSGGGFIIEQDERLAVVEKLFAEH
jgi:hypothetical protein